MTSPETDLINAAVPTAVSKLDNARDEILSLERRRRADYNRWLAGVYRCLQVAKAELSGPEFEIWCRENFGWGKRYTQLTIRAGEIQSRINEHPLVAKRTIVRELPSCEWQYRELAKYVNDETKFGEAWVGILECAGGKPITSVLIETKLKPTVTSHADGEVEVATEKENVGNVPLSPKRSPAKHEPESPDKRSIIDLTQSDSELIVAIESLHDFELERMVGLIAKARRFDFVLQRHYAVCDERSQTEREADMIKDGWLAFWDRYMRLKTKEKIVAERTYKRVVQVDRDDLVKAGVTGDSLATAIQNIQLALDDQYSAILATEPNFRKSAADWLEKERANEVGVRPLGPMESRQPQFHPKPNVPDAPTVYTEAEKAEHRRILAEYEAYDE